ncbi:MAG: alpha/beta hydrolase [Planctomycetes bacterium]|nr:alpha/beta hydrolase [Planctomycetota bacterium]
MSEIQYRTERPLRRMLRVHHPAGAGEVVLRTELDWELDLLPVELSEGGTVASFQIEVARPFLYFKPCLRAADGSLCWSVGPNLLAVMTQSTTAEVYPQFTGTDRGSFDPVVELDSAILGRRHRLRVYLPPGYAENPLRRYPVVYMQDGKNLFFPDEAFLGAEWKVDAALELLDAACAADRAIVIGIYSGDRLREYTKPGYEDYARSIVEEVKPSIDRAYRTLASAAETAVCGSSLGGVVSFFMAWQYPQVFGGALCMSSTFSVHDDLIDRVLAEPRCPAKFYLDSGWPGDNYEVTLAMALALSERGYRAREDFMHLVFPLDEHSEQDWGRRLHVPLQLALGRPAIARRGRYV